MPDFHTKALQIAFQIGVLYLNLINEEAKYPCKRGRYLYRDAEAQLSEEIAF